MQTTTEKEIVKLYRNLGFTEDVTICSCCGRVDLKGTYAIENTITGEISYLGCICAAHKMNWSKKEFVTKYKVEAKMQQEAAKKAFQATPEYIAVEEYSATIWALHREGLPFEKNDALFAAKELAKASILKQFPLANGKFLF